MPSHGRRRQNRPSPLTHQQFHASVADCQRTLATFWEIYNGLNTPDADRAAIDNIMASNESIEINDSLETLHNTFHHTTYWRRLVHNLPRRERDWVAARPAARNLLQALQRQKQFMEEALRMAVY
ncbi:hypothetical protein Hte_007107 [Hypoxylon texense]